MAEYSLCFDRITDLVTHLVENCYIAADANRYKFSVEHFNQFVDTVKSRNHNRKLLVPSFPDFHAVFFRLWLSFYFILFYLD